MTASTFVRVAAIVTLLYCAGHTAGMPWTPATGPEQKPLLESMKGLSFTTEGVTRTYWDFYFGFGAIISALLLSLAVVLWQLGAVAQASPRQVRPIVASLCVAFLANAILAWNYFFALPALLGGASAVSLLIAFVLAGRERHVQAGASAHDPH